MAKRASGERTLKRGKTRLTLRLDWRAVAELEDYFDDGIIGILTDLVSSRREQGLEGMLSSIKVTDLAKILGEMLQSGGHVDEAKIAGEIILEVGISAATFVIIDCYTATMNPEAETPKGTPTKKKKKAAS